MAIEHIDLDLCNGCGNCVDACWSDVIRMDCEQEKAVIAYSDDCIACTLCRVDCPKDAITVTTVTRASFPITLWGL